MDGALESAWKAYKHDFSEDDRKVFEDHACHGIEEYMDKLVNACQLHRDAHIRHKIYAWFEPIVNSVRLFVPVAESAMKAAPIPGAAVLGGIVALISIAERLFEYQKRSMQMLEEISISLRTLLIYEKDLYKDIDLVTKALELVYGDILTFCSRAIHFLVDKTEKGDLRARIKGFKFMTFQDFEARLGKVVDSFNRHMRQL